MVFPFLFWAKELGSLSFQFLETISGLLSDRF